LAILEVTEEKLIGGSASVTPVNNNDKALVVPKSKPVEVLPAPAVVAADIKPEVVSSALPPAEPQLTKKEIADKKKSKEIQPPVVEQKIDVAKNNSPRLEAYHKLNPVIIPSPRVAAENSNSTPPAPAKNEEAASGSSVAENSNADESPTDNLGTNLKVTCLEGSEVFVDGTRKGKVSGAPLLVSVAPGRHLVIVSHAKGMDWKFMKFKVGATVSTNPDFCNE
jgi:hypothetical protein